MKHYFITIAALFFAIVCVILAFALIVFDWRPIGNIVISVGVIMTIVSISILCLMYLHGKKLHSLVKRVFDLLWNLQAVIAFFLLQNKALNVSGQDLQELIRKGSSKWPAASSVILTTLSLTASARIAIAIYDLFPSKSDKESVKTKLVTLTFQQSVTTKIEEL